MKLKMLTSLATLCLLLLAAAIGGAESTPAAAKPGFLPGTWNGTGKIGGVVNDGFATTRFSGKLGFRIKVNPDLTVSGTGSWVRMMKGTGPVSSEMQGIATFKFSGTATAPRFKGKEDATGNLHVNGSSRPLKIDDRDVGGLLVFARAGKCSANGTVPTGEGAKLKWTAKLAINGTCNA